jgi:hypothetical protein
MNIKEKAAVMEGRKGSLSTLWIFAMFNYLYCDVMSVMDPSFLKQYLSGSVGGCMSLRGSCWEPQC